MDHDCSCLPFSPYHQFPIIFYFVAVNQLSKDLPEDKRQELTLLAELLTGCKDVEMAILFGSYARGTFVEDSYVEKGIHYEYKSDFDILIVTTHDDLKQKFRIEQQIEKKLIATSEIITTVNLIFHSIKHLNRALSEGNYFFKDIKKEGIFLYDSGKFQLQEPRKLTPAEAQKKARDYFDQWYGSANDFLKHYGYAINDMSNHIAAFHLHQATERYYTAILLVYTDYRPKEHDLEKLDLRVCNCDARFDVFPRKTEAEQHLFELLKRAYIDARYKMDEYEITRTELEQLQEYVSTLKQLTEKLCQQKIREIGGEG